MAIERQPIKLKKKLSINTDDKWYSSNVTYAMKNRNLNVSSKIFKTPNISSHTLVDLCGLNKYASVGKTLLSMFGFLERSDIPLYQSVKGGIVEEFANIYLNELYGGRYDIESFTLEQFKGFNQFPESKPFSGALDKLIHGDIKLPVEIKSKEMKDYHRIAIEGKYPKDQVVQGANQAYLYGAEKFMMLYGFIDPAVNEYLNALIDKGIFQELYGTDSHKMDFAKIVEDLELKYEHFKFHHNIMDYDYRIIQAYRNKAQKLYNEFYTTRSIPAHYFKKEELDDVKQFLQP